MVAGERHTADFYISALPFERLPAVGLPAPPFEHSPITGVHLWFDREVTTLPHATLLDRTMQWMFNKDGGRYLQLVVSASRDLTNRVARGHHRYRGGRSAPVLSPRARSHPAAGARGQRAARHFFRRARHRGLAPTGGNRISPTCSWRAIGRAPAGPPPWKAPCAAGISRPARWRAPPASPPNSCCRISRRSDLDCFRYAL